MLEQKIRGYQQPKEWVLNKVYFDYLGERLVANRGILKWDSEKGFFLDCFLDLFPPTGRSVDFRRRLPVKGDYSSIRMHLCYGGVAVAPQVRLINREDVVSQRRLSVNIYKVIFSSRSSTILRNGDYWTGNSLCKSRKVDFLSDRLRIENIIKINDNLVVSSSQESWRSVYYQLEDESCVTCYASEDGYVYTNWKLNKKSFTKQDSTSLAEAFKTSLSILTSITTKLLYYELNYDSLERKVQEFHDEPSGLGDLELIPIEQQSREVQRELLFRCSIGLARKEKSARICSRIFEQLSHAAQTNSWYIREFLVATILEASLRNIDNSPFISKKRQSNKNWEIRNSLRGFLDKHPTIFSIDVVSRVLSSHCSLRNRNAHPDWLFTEGGSLSEEEQEKALDNVIFLCSFYSYMILALLDFTDIQLKFPRPISEWGPMFTITPPVLKSAETDNITQESSKLFGSD